jgi:hypothetical protein
MIQPRPGAPDPRESIAPHPRVDGNLFVRSRRETVVMAHETEHFGGSGKVGVEEKLHRFTILNRITIKIINKSKSLRDAIFSFVAGEGSEAAIRLDHRFSSGSEVV